MVTLITRPRPSDPAQDPPADASRETRQNRRRIMMKAAKEVSVEKGGRRGEWRKLFQ